MFVKETRKNKWGLLIASQNSIARYRQMVDASGYQGEEGRGVPAISLGEVVSNLRSGDFRMGQPGSLKNESPASNGEEHTR